jgi:hypothetical protein
MKLSLYTAEPFDITSRKEISEPLIIFLASFGLLHDSSSAPIFFNDCRNIGSDNYFSVISVDRMYYIG